MIVYARTLASIAAVAGIAAVPSSGRALEYCFLDPSSGACVAAEPCPAAGCPAGWECRGGGYTYPECTPIVPVDCCHTTTGGYCSDGRVCVPHGDGYGACLPWRGPMDADACRALLEAGGGAACAAHDCDGDGVPDAMDDCVCIPDSQADADGDGIGDACDSDPTSATDAGPPPIPDAGPPPPDAGPGPDAGTDADSGVPLPAMDGGPGAEHVRWGCGCSTGGGRPTDRAWLVVVALAVMASFSPRRRRGRTHAR